MLKQSNCMPSYILNVILTGGILLIVFGPEFGSESDLGQNRAQLAQCLAELEAQQLAARNAATLADVTAVKLKGQIVRLSRALVEVQTEGR